MERSRTDAPQYIRRTIRSGGLTMPTRPNQVWTVDVKVWFPNGKYQLIQLDPEEIACDSSAAKIHKNYQTQNYNENIHLLAFEISTARRDRRPVFVQRMSRGCNLL